MKKYIVEFIGTFFLVFTVGMTVVNPGGAGNLAPLAIGSVLAVMIFAGGHISGGHYNPAVTLAVFLRGKCEAKDVGPYMGSQVAAGLVAALLTLFLKGADAEIAAAEPAILPVLMVEFIFTFALCYVVLNVATAKGTEGNSFYGFAIGFTVLVGAYAVGPISGGVFNPAVAVGISVIGLSAWANIWLFLVANLLAGAAAAAIFKMVQPGDA